VLAQRTVIGARGEDPYVDPIVRTRADALWRCVCNETISDPCSLPHVHGSAAGDVVGGFVFGTERARHTGDYALPETENGALLSQHAVWNGSGARYSSHHTAL
jgi:hypothetical protein